MRKKHVYQTPSAEVIDQVLSAPLCQSGVDVVDVLTTGGDAGNGLNDFEFIEW